MADTPKRHHFVPAFYLAGFTKTADRRGLLHVLDLNARRTRAATPDSTGFENHFYRVDGSGLDAAGVEKLLAGIDGAMAAALKRVSQAESFPSDQDYSAIVEFVALLAARGPQTRDMLTRPMEDLAWGLLELHVSTPERWNARIEQMKAAGEEVEDVPYEDMKRAVANRSFSLRYSRSHQVRDQLESATILAPILGERPWTLLVADGSGEFVCSDYPVVLTWTTPRGGFWPPGFGLPGTTVTVPLTRRVALVSQFEQDEGVVRADRLTIARPEHPDGHLRRRAIRWLRGARLHLAPSRRFDRKCR